MNTYGIVKAYIENNSLPYRGICIACGGSNTLTASIVDGWVLFYCYRASCNVKGRYRYEHSMDSIRRLDMPYRTFTNYDNISNYSDKKSTEYIIPQYFTSPLQNPRCFNFLKYWNILDCYVDGRVSIWYDPKLDRCVFGIKDHEGLFQGATGRLLQYTNNMPKWHVYERIGGCPFTTNGYSNISGTLLVEDCISCCVSSSILSSVAILGTSINPETIKFLLAYKKLYIALDDDALHKSLKIQKQLSPFVDTKIISIKKDIKYYSKLELEELGLYIDTL